MPSLESNHFLGQSVSVDSTWNLQYAHRVSRCFITTNSERLHYHDQHLPSHVLLPIARLLLFTLNEYLYHEDQLFYQPILDFLWRPLIALGIQIQVQTHNLSFFLLLVSQNFSNLIGLVQGQHHFLGYFCRLDILDCLTPGPRQFVYQESLSFNSASQQCQFVASNAF